MLAIALGILEKIWPYLLAAVLLGAAYYSADHWCNASCRAQQSRADGLQAEKKAAQDRATALALLWSATITKADDDTRQALAKQSQDFSRLADATRSLPTLPSLVLSAPTVVVFDNASDLANSRPAVEHQDSAQTLSESALAAKWTEAGAAYADAVTHWSQCVAAYEGVRNEQVH